ncbi:MAG: carotenoid biosynthesis protein [Halobacteriales archaeon]|nr:carotenoid biosynthesis protein [Halobacteriales archaeon]
MPSNRVFALTASVLGVIALTHAVLTWPPNAVVAFFVGGGFVAVVAEAIAINLGWLDHHIGPQVIGVPVYLPLAWTGFVYIAFRLALLVSTGWPAVVLTAAIATTYDLLTDHRGVAEGHWSYTDDLPGPHRRGVPWWSFAGWFGISSATAAITVPFL